MSGMEPMLIASMVAAGGSAVMEAQAQAQSLQSQAAAAEYNATVARQEAAAEEARRRRESKRQMGAMRAARAKSGVTAEGTPLLVAAESAEMAEIDALNARWTGESSARLDEARAKSAKRAIPYAVGSSLLSGVSQATGTYLTHK